MIREGQSTVKYMGGIPEPCLGNQDFLEEQISSWNQGQRQRKERKQNEKNTKGVGDGRKERVLEKEDFIVENKWADDQNPQSTEKVKLWTTSTNCF